MALRAMNLPKQGRVGRRPVHNFQIRQRPFEITPFLIAPVLPGETMRNAMLQARVVTDPIRNPLIGWWIEHYMFYVKHRDLDARDTLTAMMLDASTDLDGLRLGADDPWLYGFDGGIDFVTPCLKRVVEEYFRNEGEAWDDHVISAGRPAAKVSGNLWLDSVVPSADLIPIDVDISAADTASELDIAMRTWQFLRENSLIDMDYEDYLATYGIARETRPEEDRHRPELIRYLREWSYPSNTINPDTGDPVSAVSWAIADRADKARFFPEPGFIFGCSIARPKIYFGNLHGSAVGMLDHVHTWLPAIMRDDPQTSVITIPMGDGPIPAATGEHVADVRDLFLYGDQFVNFADEDGDANAMSLPTAALGHWYPSSNDVDALFDDIGDPEADPDPIPPTKILVRQDGVVKFTIAGTQRETSPRGRFVDAVVDIS